MSSDSEKLICQRRAGRLMADLFHIIRDTLKAGQLAKKIDQLIEEKITEKGMLPSFKGYKGYPASSCISINEEVVHSLAKDKIIKEGDMVTVDIGINNKGYHVDAARTFLITPAPKVMQEMLECANKALEAAIKKSRSGVLVKEISKTIETIITEEGFSPVVELTGHGIGRELQEWPSIPNVSAQSSDERLQKGLSLAIEPIFTEKPAKLTLADDGWTVMTDPPVLAIQVEDTIHITDGLPIILTR